MLGSQEPRVEWVPAGAEHPDGQAALELVAAAGLTLDPWQERVLRASLLQRDGHWAAFEVGVCCPRQNGKNALIEARELAGLFVLGERLIIHSAHLADTSREAFRRLEELIEANEWLSREVRHVWRTNGHESVELRSGQRVRFRTRTKGGGRGFSGDCVIFDEAMIFPEASLGAIMPTVSAKSITGNPQLWYTGSAVDQTIHEDGRVFARLRERGLDGVDDALAWFEWSLDYPNPAEVPPSVATDPAAHADSNPAFGIRISPGHIAKEQRSMAPRTFAVERLGVGDWPATDSDGAVIALEAWNRLSDPDSKPVGGLCFAFDIPPDRSSAAVAVCGSRPDRLPHVEVVDHRRSVGWLVDRLVELNERHRPLMFVCDGAGAVAALLPELRQRGVTVTTVNASEHAAGCGILFDAVDQGRLRHLGTPELAAAIRGAAKRPLGDAWAWSRRTSEVDISPLVACTLALWGLTTGPPPPFALAW